MGEKTISGNPTVSTLDPDSWVPIEQSGVTYKASPEQVQAVVALGLLARYHNSAAITAAAGNTIVDFNTSDYDPLSLVATGAGWVFTAPANGWYSVEAENFYVDPNGGAYGADVSVSLTVRLNGASLSGNPDLYYWDSGDGVASVDKYVFMPGRTTFAADLGDTIALNFNNSSGATRKIASNAAIVIRRER